MLKLLVALSLMVFPFRTVAEAEICVLPAIADSVDLKNVPGSDLVTVPVTINGKSRQFLLDVGTNPSQIAQATVSELGLPQSNKLTEATEAVKLSDLGTQFTTIQVPVYNVKGAQDRNSVRTRIRVASFAIGRAATHNMQFLLADDPEMGRSEPYDGLLTDDFFKQYDVELDFAGKQINYLTPTKCNDPDQVVFWSHLEVAVIPATLIEGKIRIPVTVDGHLIDAVVDTSSPRTVARRDFAELSLGLKANTSTMVPAKDIKDGTGQQVYLHTFAHISFSGGVTALNVPGLIQVGSMAKKDTGLILGSKAQRAETGIPNLTLGMDVLHQLHLYVAFTQQKLYVTAAK